MSRKYPIIIGQVYGNLTLIESRYAESGHTRALFECTCGKQIERNLSSLTGDRRYPASCGCLVKRKTRGKIKRPEGFSPLAQSFYLGRT